MPKKLKPEEPVLKVERVALAELHEDPENANHHDDVSIDGIAASLREFGQQKAIVVDGDGKVIAGNGQYLAALKLGWTHMDVHRTKLTGKAALAYALADNRVAQLSAFDTEKLAKALEKLDGLDLSAMGFSAEETKALLGIGDLTDGENAEAASDGQPSGYTEKVVISIKDLSLRSTVRDAVAELIVQQGWQGRAEVI